MLSTYFCAVGQFCSNKTATSETRKPLCAICTPELYGDPMKYRASIAVLSCSALFLFLAASPTVLLAQQQKPTKVLYVQSSVLSSSSDVIKLLDGSRWVSSSATFALPASDIIIVILDQDGNGVAYSSGFEFPVSHLTGTPITASGTLSTVERTLGRGAVLELRDGSLWEVSDYDQYHTSYWLPPYRVIITSDELYMINLKEAKKIWVSRIKR